MATEHDFTVPEDRALKVAEFEAKRQAWISTRSCGKVRFVLFSGVLREVVPIVVLNSVYAVLLHVSIALAARVTLLVLLMGRVFNQLEWYWNEKRFVTKG
jgi:hypothetical protein